MALRVRDVNGRSHMVALPEGWRHVTAGLVEMGDKYLNIIKLADGVVEFKPVDAEDVDSPIKNFQMIIRDVVLERKQWSYGTP